MIKTFRFNILSDSAWETHIDKGLDYFGGVVRHFEIKDYGTDVKGIVIVMMCRSPELIFKQRKRFSKKDKFFYLDIMLDYYEMVKTSDNLTKAKIMLSKINSELFTNLEKHKFKDFDLARFKTDFGTFTKDMGL